MIARLQLFYGGDPMVWLRCPVGVLNSYARYVEKLQAGESLTWVQRLLIGSGSVKKTDSQRQINRWSREATEGSVKRAAITEEERRELARGMGIQVV